KPQYSQHHHHAPVHRRSSSHFQLVFQQPGRNQERRQGRQPDPQERGRVNGHRGHHHAGGSLAVDRDVRDDEEVPVRQPSQYHGRQGSRTQQKPAPAEESKGGHQAATPGE